MSMQKQGPKFGKFDIVSGSLLGQPAQYVVEGYWSEWHANRGGSYQVVNLSNASTAQKFADELKLVSRHPDNAELDREYSELASAKNHAFNQMRLEFSNE